MLVLSVLVIGMLAVEALVPLDPATLEILLDLDMVICGFFFLDFLYTLKRAPNRWRYLVTWGWIDLLSSIPAVTALRWGRAARLARLLRILRGIRSARELVRFLLHQRRAEGALYSLILITLLTVMFSSIAIIHLEASHPDATIRDASDALWWSVVTITTVGYGDAVPVTHAGRALAAGLMVVGIGMFGTFTAFIASWFVQPVEVEQERELEAIRKDLRALREFLGDKAGHSDDEADERPSDGVPGLTDPLVHTRRIARKLRAGIAR